MDGRPYDEEDETADAFAQGVRRAKEFLLARGRSLPLRPLPGQS